MGTLAFIDPANWGVAWPPIVEQKRVAIRVCAHLCDGIRLSDASRNLIYKLVVVSSMEGFAPPFSTEEACSKT
jgi:hypothetical protein